MSGRKRKVLGLSTIVLIIIATILTLPARAVGEGDGTETTTTTTETTSTTPEAPTDPWLDEAYRAQVVAANKRARYYKRKTHRYCHKLARHCNGTHRPLHLTHSLAYETWRAKKWRSRMQAIRQLYLTCARPRPVVRRVRVKGARANRHQRQMITRVLNVGRKMRAKPKVMAAAVATITQESSATNLHGGHGSSVGLFQIIDSNVPNGEPDRRRVPEWAARWFFSRAININKHRPGLSVGQLSQAVQRSAYPSAYNQWVPEAWRTYRRYLGPCPR